MRGAAVRSRLLALRRRLVDARGGHDLLERKREILLREVMQRAPRLDALRRGATARLAAAARRLSVATVEAGRTRVGAAALAQPETAFVEYREHRIAGVSVPRLHGQFGAFRPAYGPAETTAAIDHAGSAYADLLPDLVRLAQEEMVTAALQRALARTIRRLKALETLVIPSLEHEIRRVADALEEEERDEAVRRRRWKPTAASERPLGA